MTKPEISEPGIPDEGSVERQTSSIYWWVFPSRLTLFIHLPIFLICWSMDETVFAYYRHAAKFLEGDTALVGLACILCFALASAWFEPSRAYSAAVILDRGAVDAALIVLFAIVLGSYAMFLAPVAVQPRPLLELLGGSTTAMFELRDTLNHVPGITSFMSLQSLIAVLIVTYSALTGASLRPVFRQLSVCLIAACVLRALMWSERLALIELVLPAAVAMAARIPHRFERAWLRPFTLAPAFGVIFVFAAFAAGEYFRSWQFYQFTYPGSFMEFISIRFIGYYATALNNGSALCAVLDPLYTPMLTSEWFYKFPLWQFLAESARPMMFVTNDFLDIYLNREFNNMSGIYLPAFDFGPVIGIMCWVALGAFSGVMMRSFAAGEIGGLLFFPVFYTGVVEMLRLFYWGDPRFFPVMLATPVLAWWLRRPRTAIGGLMWPSAGAAPLRAPGS